MIFTIAWRELVERRFFFATAVALALLPFGAALLPDARRHGYQDHVAVTAGSLAVGIPLAMALILGATLVGRELAERRMSFYFSKPLGAVSLWMGKVLAALITLAASFAVILWPTLLAFGARWSKNWGVDVWEFTALIVGGSFVIFLITHAISTMLRSRSPWIAIDFVLLAITLAVVWMIARPLVTALAVKMLIVVAKIFGALFVVVLASAGAYQLAHGRTDPRRNHAALSRYLWISMAIVLAITGGIVAWVTTVPPEELRFIGVNQAPNGKWAAIGGDASGRLDYIPMYLLDAETGDYRRLGVAPRFFPDATFSSDGRFMIVPEGLAFRRNSSELVLHDLERGTARPTDIEITPDAELVLSDDSSRLAIVQAGIVAVYDLASGKLLSSVRMPSRAHRNERMFFPSPDVLRLYRRVDTGVTSGEIDIYECRVAAKQLVKLGSIPLETNGLLSATRDGSRLLVRRFGDVENPDRRWATVYDGTGKPVFEIPRNDAKRGVAALLLENGGVAHAQWVDRHAHLVAVDALGKETTRIPLGTGRTFYLVEEIVNGKVLVASQVFDARQSQFARSWESMVVDLVSGRIERRENLMPANVYTWHQTDPRTLPSARPRLFHDASGSLVSWNVVTGEKKILVKRRAAD